MEYLSSHEKQMIKDRVINDLNIRIPATPNLYDLVWDTDASMVLVEAVQGGGNALTVMPPLTIAECAP